jgi:hypothetical protein
VSPSAALGGVAATDWLAEAGWVSGTMLSSVCRTRVAVWGGDLAAFRIAQRQRRPQATGLTTLTQLDDVDSPDGDHFGDLRNVGVAGPSRSWVLPTESEPRQTRAVISA